MEQKDNILKDLERAVQEHDTNAMNKGMEAAAGLGISEKDLRQALFQGLEHQRRKMMSNDAPVPHFLLSLDTMHEGMKKMSSASEFESSMGIVLVIGVVEGDPHDLGKNIISRIYSASGYEVHDLGREVSVENFVASVKEKQARVLALSAMMSTTMVQMSEIIKRVRAECPQTVIMVGGAPLDTDIAGSFGADGYAESAVTVLEETEAAIERVSAK